MKPAPSGEGVWVLGVVRLISVRAGSRSFRGLRIPDVLRRVVVLGPRSGGGWGGA